VRNRIRTTSRHQSFWVAACLASASLSGKAVFSLWRKNRAIVTPCIGIYFFTVYSLGACQRASIYTCSLYCRRSMFEDRCLMLCFLEAGLVLIRPTSDLLALKCRKEDRAEYVRCEGVKNYTAVMRFWGSVGVVSVGCGSILFSEQFTSAVRRGII
jgi:hypothetical protein